MRLAGLRLARSLPGLAPTFVIVAILACVLVPLPTPLVDLLLSMSLAGAVLLLVVSLGVRRTSDFLNFPSLLLLATLYRLALNVSTTRLILSQADAGRVIDTFAEFVIRDDLVVGAVMFAIITIVQYVVIARGAERVAEVAARFALDGLPGSQAAIDADLRAGVISAREASARRSRLIERSNFYGAMDGAVRFVKGDAIAGLAITAVNVIGGLAIGVGRQGLSWTDALDTYARLTVGDGLLAQIPALLVSLAAGVLVSRVDRESEGAPGRLVGWLEPAMLLVPAVMLALLALVPSMPRLAFLATAVGLVTAAVALALRSSARPQARRGPAQGRWVTVRVSAEDLADVRSVERALAETQFQCATALGIEVPEFELDHDSVVAKGRAELRIDGRVCGSTDVTPGPDGEDALVLLAFRGVMDHAPDLVDLQDLDRMLEGLRATHPAVVHRALEAVDVVDVLAVVRGFLRERAPLPPLRAILGVLAENRRFREVAERPRFADLARVELAAHWVPAVLEALERLGEPAFVRLTPDAEDELMDRWMAGVDGGVLNLSSPERAAWIEAIRAFAVETSAVDAPSEASGRRPVVLLASVAARPALAELVSGALPRITVLSTAEFAAVRDERDVEWLAGP